MNDSKRIELFETAPIPRAVLTLSIPMVLSSLVMVLYNMADTFFVGMLNDPIENSGVSLAAPVMLAFNAVTNLFGVGASSVMSRALGKRDYATVEESSAFGFYCTLVCGLLFCVLCTVFQNPLLDLLGADDSTREATRGYMLWTVFFGTVPALINIVLGYFVRAEGSAIHASIGTMGGCLLNIILDPIFILPFGLNMGAAGAGLATFISNCAACLYFFVLLFVRRGKTYVSISPRRLRFKRNMIREIFSVGVPASIQNLLNVTSMTVLNNFTANFGADAVAAMGISYKLYMIPMQIGLGFGQGIMPLVGYNFASGNRTRMKKAIIFAYKIIIPTMMIMTVCYCLCAGPFVRAFMDNDAIVMHGERILRGFSLGIVFLCIDFLAVGVFQALGLGKYALLFAFIRKAVLEIPALIVLNHFFPLYGLGYAQFVSELILSVIAVLMLRRLFKKYQDELRPAVG